MKHQSSNQFNILKQKVADKLWPKYVPWDPSYPRSPPLLAWHSLNSLHSAKTTFHPKKLLHSNFCKDGEVMHQLFESYVCIVLQFWWILLFYDLYCILHEFYSEYSNRWNLRLSSVFFSSIRSVRLDLELSGTGQVCHAHTAGAVPCCCSSWYNMCPMTRMGSLWQTSITKNIKTTYCRALSKNICVTSCSHTCLSQS